MIYWIAIIFDSIAFILNFVLAIYWYTEWDKNKNSGSLLKSTFNLTWAFIMILYIILSISNLTG